MAKRLNKLTNEEIVDFICQECARQNVDDVYGVRRILERKSRPTLQSIFSIVLRIKKGREKAAVVGTKPPKVAPLPADLEILTENETFDHLSELVHSLRFSWREGDLGEFRRIQRTAIQILKQFEKKIKDQLWNNLK